MMTRLILLIVLTLAGCGGGGDAYEPAESTYNKQDTCPTPAKGEPPVLCK